MSNLTKAQLEQKVKELGPWHYCHILPYGVSTGDSLVPVQSEKLLLLDKAGAFPAAEYPNVLDLGANSGLISMWFADNKNSKVWAAEFDDHFYAQLEFAVEQKGYQDKVISRHRDITTGGYGHSEYDLVLFLGVMHHLPAITHNVVFESAFEALKPNGQMVVQTVGTQLVLKHLHAAGFSDCHQLDGYAQGDRLAWVGTKKAEKRATKARRGAGA